MRCINWIGLIITQNHPEYPAAHCCFSDASTKTMEFFFGTDSFNFTMDSTVAGVTNPVRYYTSFSQALRDILDARIYGGHALPETRIKRDDHRQAGRSLRHKTFLPATCSAQT